MKPQQFAFLVSLGIFTFGLLAASADNALPVEESNTSYRLMERDRISIAVFGEPDVTTVQRIDGSGYVRIPLIGPLEVVNKTIRELEESIQIRYIEEDIFLSPIVTVRIEEYSPKAIYVLGQVRRPGLIPFDIEINSMDIVEAVSRAGGFTPTARGSRVQVTRYDRSGNEEIFSLDVDRMIEGGRRRADPQNTFPLFPGDILFVPERFF